MKRAAIFIILGFFWIFPANAFDIQELKTSQNTTVWLVEDHSNPIISVSLAFRGGAVLDPESKAGLASMSAALLDEGAGDMDAKTYQERLRDQAISVRFSVTQDAFYGTMSTLSENAEEAFLLLGLALTKPRFDEDAVQRIRGQMMASLAMQLQDPDAIAGRAFARLIYPDHPYGVPSDGVPATINAITTEDLGKFVKEHLAQDNMILSVVGDIGKEQLLDLIERHFSALPAKSVLHDLPEAEIKNEGRVEIIRRSIPQSVAVFGHEGIKRDDPDWYAATIVNYILGGGGFSSRLMHEIREERGLSYGVQTYLAPGILGGLIEGTVSSRNDLIAKSLQLIRSEWAHMSLNGITEEELENAKTYLTGAFPLQMDSTRNLAGVLTMIQRGNLGIDYLDRYNSLIRGVTKEDADRVAGRLLDARRLSVIVVGDPEGL